MQKKPIFVLSLDCEGLWGMLDQDDLVASGQINTHSLRNVYQEIHQVLQENQVQCTAAFVSAFAAPLALLEDCNKLIGEQAEENPAWFNNLKGRIEKGEAAMDGFLGHDFFRLFQKAGHEMAWHGSTHVSWDESTSDSSIRREQLLSEKISGELGFKPVTMIFPRNKAGHFDRLKECCVNSYREGDQASVLNRISNLSKEFSSYNSSKNLNLYRSNDLVVHPKGDFLNWPNGVRGLVPLQVTCWRWKSMIDNAIKSNGYVHMWFHPHNLITSPSMRILFKEIIDYVGLKIKAGHLECMTMKSHTEMMSEII